LDDRQGNWGYVNKNGVEIIKPQYIFAGFFEDGAATVCIGKWTIDKKWDNEYNQCYYWTEQEKWGLIDKDGNYIIPCVYDDPIICISDCPHGKMPIYYSAHKFDDKKETWQAAIFDSQGKVVLDFGKYSRIDYCSTDGQIEVCINGWLYEEGTLCGVFDLNEMKEIIAPKHPYVEVISKNIFLVSDDCENGADATLINNIEEPLSDLEFWSVSQDFKNKNLFKGTLMQDRQEIKFTIIDNQIKII
jgi:hypothetical protein